MKVGFTGTRTGMTSAQSDQVAYVLNLLGVTEFHHGDCVGADAEAHELARARGAYVVIHPPVDEIHRAFCRYADETLPALTHFARNREIVKNTEVLVAAPPAMVELTQGGTWHTINYGKKQLRDVYICWPDGSLTKHCRP